MNYLLLYGPRVYTYFTLQSFQKQQGGKSLKPSTSLVLLLLMSYLDFYARPHLFT